MRQLGGISPKIATNRPSRALDGVCGPGGLRHPAPPPPHPSPFIARSWAAASPTHRRVHRRCGGGQSDPYVDCQTGSILRTSRAAQVGLPNPPRRPYVCVAPMTEPSCNMHGAYPFIMYVSWHGSSVVVCAYPIPPSHTHRTSSHITARPLVAVGPCGRYYLATIAAAATSWG